MKITQTEFITKYCKQSGTNEKSLNDLGLFAMPCSCNSQSCEGWGMVTFANVLNHIEIDMQEFHEKMRDGVNLILKR